MANIWSLSIFSLQKIEVFLSSEWSEISNWLICNRSERYKLFLALIPEKSVEFDTDIAFKREGCRLLFRKVTDFLEIFGINIAFELFWNLLSIISKNIVSTLLTNWVNRLVLSGIKIYNCVDSLAGNLAAKYCSSRSWKISTPDPSTDKPCKSTKSSSEDLKNLIFSGWIVKASVNFA